MSDVRRKTFDHAYYYQRGQAIGRHGQSFSIEGIVRIGDLIWRDSPGPVSRPDTTNRSDRPAVLHRADPPRRVHYCCQQRSVACRRSFIHLGAPFRQRPSAPAFPTALRPRSCNSTLNLPRATYPTPRPFFCLLVWDTAACHDSYQIASQHYTPSTNFEISTWLPRVAP